MITALRPRAETEMDNFALDPYCRLYLPLWKLDGDSFMSKDAYGHLCTNHGSLWAPQGRKFDGTDAYIDCGNDSNLVGEKPAQTWEFWFNAHELAYDTLAYILVDSADANNRILFYHDKLYVTFNGGDIDMPLDFSDIGNWHHLVATYDKSDHTARFYLDNNLEVVNDSGAGNVSAFSGNLLLGGRNVAGYSFNGTVGVANVLARALTPQEISYHYIVGKELFA